MEPLTLVLTITGLVIAGIVGAWQVYLTHKQVKQKKPSVKSSAIKLIESVSLKEKTGFIRLKVITHPRFIDSAIFMQILNTQPFESLGINCELVKADWRSVPEQVSSHWYDVGFNNRLVVCLLESGFWGKFWVKDILGMEVDIKHALFYPQQAQTAWRFRPELNLYYYVSSPYYCFL